MENKSPIHCYFTLHGINYKNGFVTSCPQQPEQFVKMSQTIKPSEIFNHENFRKHRLEMMSGEWSRGCHLCKEPERIGSASMRQDYPVDLSLYVGDPFYIGDQDKTTEPGESWPRGLKHVEVRFSNSCNMACRHCSTVYSSGWVSKLKHYVPDDEVKIHDLKQLLRTEHRDGDDDKGELEITLDQVEEIVTDLCEYAIGLEKVEFAGGEVLNQKQFFHFLKLLAKHPNASDLIIGFHTNFNANFDPEELHHLLDPFARAIIHISVDAGKNIYPYFRTGDWEKLKSNIAKFRQFNDRADIVAVITTSAYQILDLQNIFSSLLEIDFLSIDASIVYSPVYLNPALLTFKFKNDIINDINETRNLIEKEFNRRLSNKEFNRLSWYENRLYTDIFRAKRALADIETYVLKTDLEAYSKNLGYDNLTNEIIYNRFCVYIKKTDEIWKQDFNEYMVNYKFINGQIERVTNV